MIAEKAKGQKPEKDPKPENITEEIREKEAEKYPFSTLNLLFLENDDFLQGPFTAKCNGQKMK